MEHDVFSPHIRLFGVSEADDHHERGRGGRFVECPLGPIGYARANSTEATMQMGVQNL
jgi:hypothetical protein